MNNLKNRVQLIGNLGKDPEVKHLDNGKVVAKFTMATSETYKNKHGEKVTDTQWHNIIAWGRQAEIAEKYFEKGKEIAIDGKLLHRSFEDKEGNMKYFTEIQVNEFLMLNRKAS